MQMRIGGSLDDRVAIEGVKLGDEFNSQVVDALIQLALQIGQEGFEGHPIGTIITIGDHNNVLEKSRQITINPFQGLGESRAQRARSEDPRGDQELLGARRGVRHPRGRRGALRGPLPVGRRTRT